MITLFFKKGDYSYIASYWDQLWFVQSDEPRGYTGISVNILTDEEFYFYCLMRVTLK